MIINYVMYKMFIHNKILINDANSINATILLLLLLLLRQRVRGRKINFNVNGRGSNQTIVT